MIFGNDQEIWEYLLQGGTVKEIYGEKTISLVAGNKTYGDGSSAKSCLLSFDYWIPQK